MQTDLDLARRQARDLLARAGELPPERLAVGIVEVIAALGPAALDDRYRPVVARLRRHATELGSSLLVAARGRIVDDLTELDLALHGAGSSVAEADGLAADGG